MRSLTMEADRDVVVQRPAVGHLGRRSPALYALRAVTLLTKAQFLLAQVGLCPAPSPVSPRAVSKLMSADTWRIAGVKLGHT